MVRVLLIVGLAACSASSTPTKAPRPDLGGPPSATPVPETLWDSGTFVVIDKEKLDPEHEESFQLFQTGPDQFRMAITWKRRMPTGELADGKVDLRLDAQFVPTSGTDEMTLHAAKDEITKSTLSRLPDGRMTTEQIAANGSKTAFTSAQPNDWFLGSMFTSFLFVMCRADAARPAPLVYPDKITELEPFKPLPIPSDEARKITWRRLTYVQSKREVIAACENGKLAGEVTRGVTIVRKGDEALARELERWFR